MHGRPRKVPTAEEQEASALKASKLRALQSQFLYYHQNKIYTKEALELNAQLLEANPEYLTAWNYRKLAVEHNLSQTEAEVSVKSILDPELKLVEVALRKNPKSYGAWYHRKWVLSRGHSSTDHEVRLLREFQKLDSRNFHAWNYRRFITELRSVSPEEELDYMTNMIYDNFSSYSAWHNRGVLLSHLMQKRAQGYTPEIVLAEEFEFVRHALFTDPDDQSGWFYHLWLLDQTIKSDIPFLVSSWPPHGSDLCVSFDGSTSGHVASPFLFLKSNDGIFPLIFFFNEVVEGVNSTTVTVEWEGDVNYDLVWLPLSANESWSSQAWVAFVKVPDPILHPAKVYLIKVSLGYSQGITSLHDGLPCNPCNIEFNVAVQGCCSEHGEEYDVESITWSDKCFCAYNVPFQESSPSDLLHYLRISNGMEPAVSAWKADIVANEIDHCRELLSAVDCKIGKLTLARLFTASDIMMSSKKLDSQDSFHFEEVMKLLLDLIKLDPKHHRYYKDKHSLMVFKQITSSVQSLFTHLHQYIDGTFSRMTDFICLRLHNLSLSRVGSVERLLWVQMLDLSNNQLQSVEGLDALQLLHSLNLSSNKICSFTALDPLRLLKFLKRLNISYNEIGAHSIDTRRYMCPSPMSHARSDWNAEEIGIIGSMTANYWDAYLLFKNMKLTQLDIVGNVVVNESFKLLLLKLLPHLRRLDGKELS